MGDLNDLDSSRYAIECKARFTRADFHRYAARLADYYDNEPGADVYDEWLSYESETGSLRYESAVNDFWITPFGNGTGLEGTEIAFVAFEQHEIYAHNPHTHKRVIVKWPSAESAQAELILGYILATS